MKIVWVGIVFILVSSLVYSLPVQMIISPLEQRATFEDQALFNLTLRNQGPDHLKLRLFSPNFPEWDFNSEPLENPIHVEIGPQETKTLTVRFQPLHVNAIGVYSLPVHVQNIETLETNSMKFRVSLLSLNKGKKSYVPSVKVITDQYLTVDPRNTGLLRVSLENLNLLDLSQLTVQIRGDLFSADVSTSLTPRGERDATKTLQIPVDLPDNLVPQEETLLITLLSENKKIADVALTTLSIAPYNVIDTQAQSRHQFLRSHSIITYTNKGNVRFDGDQQVPTAFFERLFSRTNPRASTGQNSDGYFYAFTLHLIPGESQTVYIFTNYYPVAIILLLLVIGVALYYLYRSPLTVTKHATDVTYADGGISGLRVNIHLKNRSSIPIKDIVVTDRAPRMAVLEQGLSLGSLPPSSTKRYLDGSTQMTWHIDDLGTEEERMITFRVKTPLSVVGEYTLSSAIAHYSYAGRKGSQQSRQVTVNSQ